MALHRFTKKEKQECAALYFATNSFAEVERQSGGRFKARTCKLWEAEDEDFLKAYETCATMGGKELIGTMRQFVDKSLAHALNILETDPEAVKFRDAILAAGIIHDKRQVMEGKVTSRTGTGESMKDMLESVEKELAIKAQKREEAKNQAAEKSDKVVAMESKRFKG